MSKPITLGRAIANNATLLGLFAALTAGVIGLTYIGTKDRIAAAEKQAAERALLEIVSPDGKRIHDNDLLSDSRAIDPRYWSALGLKNGGQYHIARAGDKVLAYLFPAVAPDGYSGNIKLLVGVRPDGRISGVRVLSHKETPGLGDKVDIKKSLWVLGFNGKHLDKNNASDWAVKKDGGQFDAFTGATITPRAVVNQVKRVLQTFADLSAETANKASVQP